MNIEKSLWHNCIVCHQNIKNLSKIYGGTGVYYTEVFEKHLLQDHKISLETYFELCSNRPYCACNICDKQTSISKRGSNFYWSKYACGRNPGLLEWSEKAKITRAGKGNPMFGQKPWNKDLNKKTNSSLQIVSNKLTGRIVNHETKQKQSASAKARNVHGHTGCKHSQESKNKMRDATLYGIAKGRYKHLKTKPHIEMSSILTNIGIKFIEEYRISFWSFDFYLPDFHVLIEVDGDYFHTNQKIYPGGPQTNTQKINFYRDLKKNKFCIEEQVRLIRFWESDILGNKELVICELQKLLV